MNDSEKYIKYYFLENYLFSEVSAAFKERGFLAPEEFFAILIWKSNRSKTKIRDSILKNGKTVRGIMTEVSKADTPGLKLDILDSVPYIGIPIASAILSVCYPDDFTVADYRACAAIKKYGKEINGNPTASKTAYFEYLNACKELARESNLSLRDFDRMLWAKDFYAGANGLRDLIKGLK